MKTTIPSVSKQLEEKQIFQAINKNYSQLRNVWFNFQMEWLESSYRSFNDHDKFLIVQYLVLNTLNFLSNNFVKLDFDTYYSKKQIEIANFNIIDISRGLYISKETARRKVLELEKIGAIVRDKKKIILNRSAFKYQKPNQSIVNTSYLLSKVTETLSKSGDMDKKFNSEIIQLHMKKNFTQCWKLFYEMQIPYVLSWKKYFGDIETWNIWGIIVTQKSFKTDINKFEKLGRTKYLEVMFKDIITGINAMSISELSGVPRATVVRKINNLLKKKLIFVDKKKLYTAGNVNTKKFINMSQNSMGLLTTFFCKIINLLQTN